MVTRPDLLDRLLFSILVYLFDNLCVVFNNARQLSLGKNVLPEISNRLSAKLGEENHYDMFSQKCTSSDIYNVLREECSKPGM